MNLNEVVATLGLLTIKLKELEQSQPDLVAKAIQQWAIANVDSLRGKDGLSVTPEQLQATVAAYFADNADTLKGKDGKDGQDGADGRDGLDAEVTPEQIQAAVNLWLELNLERLRGVDGKDGLNGANGTDGKDGLDGRDGLDGKDGSDGLDGVGIKDIYQYAKTNTITIELTNGDIKKFNLPLPKATRGGGTSNQQVVQGVIEVVAGENVTVDNTDPKRPIVSATGGGGTNTELKIDGGSASTVFNDYVLRLDFGRNGATINPTGTP